jgi:outer membrane protein assembly factor BamA
MAPRLVLTLAFFPLQEGLRVFSRRARKGDSTPGSDDDVRTVSLLPHASYTSGFGPTLGVAGRYGNLGGHDEEASVTAGVGGVYAQFAEVALHADRAAGSRVWIESRTRYEIKPQQIFQGIGDGDAVESRYREERLLAAARAGLTLGEKGRLVRVGGSLVFERSRFGPKDDGESSAPSTDVAYDTHDLVGFDRGVRTLEVQANLIVDTRDELAAPSKGMLAAVFLGAVPNVDGYRYVHVGADVSEAIDLYKGNRILLLRAAYEGVHGPAAQVPFARLPRLGGPQSLRGYRTDRYRDRDSALVSAEYEYPIHDGIAGAVFVDAGHVAPDPASLTALERWRAGGGIGLRVRTHDALLASIDLAYGDGVQLFFTVLPLDAHPRWTPP